MIKVNGVELKFSNRKKRGYIHVWLTLRSPADARIEEEAKRRKVHTDEVLNELFTHEDFMYGEFGQIPTPKDVDLDDDEEFFGWVVSEFAMKFLPPSRRELQ